MMFHSTHSEQCIALKGRALRGAFWLGIVLMFGVMGSARADQPGPELVLSAENGDLKVGPGMNASGRDLAGCRFVVQDLRGANFDNANLDGAVLWDCKLQGASFRGAFLTGLTTEDCEFADADFTDATINGVLGVHMYPAGPELGHKLTPDQFRSTGSYKLKDLSDCSISAPMPREKSIVVYDFRGMDLRGALLAQGNFSHSRFDNALIDGMRLGFAASCSFDALSGSHGFNCHPKKLLGLRLGGKLLGDWDLSHAIIERSSLLFATGHLDLTDARLVDCSLSWLPAGVIIGSKNYQEQDFSNISLRQCDLQGHGFRGFDLTNAVFYRSELSEADFSDAIITGARFVVTDPAEVVEQIKQTWNYKNNQMESVKLERFPKSGHWNWETGQLEVR